MLLLDSDVLIEVQRGRQEAKEWLQDLSDQVALPAAVAWEMLYGSRDKQELQKSERFLNSFAVEQLTSADSALVQQLVVDHLLSSGLSLPDYLIAAQAISRGATLITFNTKHFQVIPILKISKPYER
jgi:tRNA(fMet)-specific endonuclease VapC